MAHQHGPTVAKVTTLPATPGLKVRVCEHDAASDTELAEVASGETGSSGAWSFGHGLDPDTRIVLVLENEERELIRCRTLIRNLDPMECLMVEPGALSHDELWSRWRKAERDLKGGGSKNPDPNDIAIRAFMRR